VNIVIESDGQILKCGDISLTFYLAPGHTDQGIFVVFEPQNIWVAGDYLSDIEFPLVSGSLREYHNTMYKADQILQHHPIRYLIPGHGTVADSTANILLRRDHALQYLDDLESHITHGVAFPEDRYRERYPFWDGIRDWHRQNITHLSSV
jgi:glyoxylase-like metal-dependent hydrolase (beta-lactamase superfamily II)